MANDVMTIDTIGSILEIKNISTTKPTTNQFIGLLAEKLFVNMGHTDVNGNEVNVTRDAQRALNWAKTFFEVIPLSIKSTMVSDYE